MTVLDEFRIRVSIANHNLKRKLAEILIKLASKFDQEVVRDAKIGLKFRCNLEKYIPNDNQFHHFAMTVDCHIKRNNQKKQKKISEKYYVDGNLVKSKEKNTCKKNK